MEEFVDLTTNYADLTLDKECSLLPYILIVNMHLTGKTRASYIVVIAGYSISDLDTCERES